MFVPSTGSEDTFGEIVCGMDLGSFPEAGNWNGSECKVTWSEQKCSKLGR